MNNNEKAWPAQKQSVQANWEPNSSDTRKGKVEGILTSPIKLKHTPQEAYFWAFFQLERSSEVFNKASQGLNHDIPVIFKIKKEPFLPLPNIPISGYDKPEIPFRSKVLLEGTWSDMNMRQSPTSNRPSFTCTNYEILANPPPLTVKDLKEEINSLLTISLDKKQEWQQRTDYLFKKKRDLEDLEKLSKLGKEYLSAYLLLRRAFYSNYQDNLLSHNQFSQAEYLNKLASEIEEVACQIRAYESKDMKWEQVGKPTDNK